MIDNIFNQDCLEGIKSVPSESVDCILTDPPYLYLKNQKLERHFDEPQLFKEFKRVLKKGGFIVLFGRGTSFYRWNSILAELGFTFKEEFIWDKGHNTSPLLPVSRIHETVSIHSKGKGSINRVKVDYIESKKHDISKIVDDIKRLKTVFSNSQNLNHVLEYIETNYIRRDEIKKANMLGCSSDIRTENRCVSVLRSIKEGCNEKTIIRIPREHYKSIHPTQKPVKLLKRLLNLVTKDGDVVLDPFVGSASTCVACRETGRHFIGFEIDEEYFNNALERLKNNSIEQG